MSGEAPGGRKRDIRLTPPPRIEPVGSRPRGRGWRLAVLLGVLGLLVGLATVGYLEVVSEWRSHAGERPAPAGADAGEGLAPSRAEDGGTDLARSRTDHTGEGLAPSKEDVREGPEPSRTPETAGASPAPTPIEERPEASPAPTAPGGAAAVAPSRALADDGFGTAMAEGLAALDEGDLSAARAAFTRAASIRPDSPEPPAGLARLDAVRDRAAIEERRARAAELVGEEEWHRAADEYRAALELDPTLTFARQGLRLAEARAELSDRIAYHLDHPDRLAAAGVLAEADRLLESAREISPAGPRHAEQIASLESLLERVRQPVRVALVSDALTEVTVYQVGRLGAFTRRELELRPGVYTVVGSRAGYRDVRRQLRVEPGASPEPFEIRCEEEI